MFPDDKNFLIEAGIGLFWTAAAVAVEALLLRGHLTLAMVCPAGVFFFLARSVRELWSPPLAGRDPTVLERIRNGRLAERARRLRRRGLAFPVLTELLAGLTRILSSVPGRAAVFLLPGSPEGTAPGEEPGAHDAANPTVEQRIEVAALSNRVIDTEVPSAEIARIVEDTCGPDPSLQRHPAVSSKLVEEFFTRLTARRRPLLPLRRYLDLGAPEIDSVNRLRQTFYESLAEKSRAIPALAGDPRFIERLVNEGLETMYNDMPAYIFHRFYADTGLTREHTLMHSLGVLGHALDIIAREPAQDIDYHALVYACLMHDISMLVYGRDHEVNSSHWTRALMNAAGMEPGFVDKVVLIELGHRKVKQGGSLRAEHRLAEARIIHDADILDATMNLPRILRVKVSQHESWRAIRGNNAPAHKLFFFNPSIPMEQRIEIFSNGDYVHQDALTDLVYNATGKRDPNRFITPGGKEIARTLKVSREAMKAFIGEQERILRVVYDFNDNDLRAIDAVIDGMYWFFQGVPPPADAEWRNPAVVPAPSGSPEGYAAVAAAA